MQDRLIRLMISSVIALSSLPSIASEESVPQTKVSAKRNKKIAPALSSETKSIAAGSSKREITVNGIKIDVFTYKPKNYNDGPLFVIFHGVKRNADVYRDNAIEMADRFGALIVAPKFDLERFPTRAYQHGGILDADRRALPREKWTYAIVPKIIDQVRTDEGKPSLPYYLIGHSAGGQFLVRYAGFMKTDAQRIVAVNPGTTLFPSMEHKYPYGFDDLPVELNSDEAMQRYLAQPLTIFLGTADLDRTENLSQVPQADKQGRNRVERATNLYSLGRELAKKKGWEFNWRFVEADGINHTSKGMFNHKNCEKAIFGDVKSTK